MEKKKYLGVAMKESKPKSNGWPFYVLLLLPVGSLGYSEITPVMIRWEKISWEAMTPLKQKPTQPQGAADFCRSG